MKKILVLILALASFLSAKTSIWKVSDKNNNIVYLGGTLHLFTKGDKMPITYKEVYDKSDVLYFETDIKNIESPETIAYMNSALSYKNEKITNYINEDTKNYLSSYFSSLGLDYNNFTHYKPGMLMMLFTVFELQKSGSIQDGVDSRVEKWARDDNKQTKYFESLKEQIDILANVGVSNEDKFIRYNLDEMKNFKEDFSALKKAWFEGDLVTFQNLGIKKLGENIPLTYDILLKNRNDNWMKQIPQMFDSKEVEFVLVGALHLAGKDGLLEQLKRLGYKVEQL